MSSATSVRVQQAIAELDYHPSHAAQSLAGQRSGVIGVVSPGVASGFFTDVLCGLDDIAAEYRFHLATVFTRGSDDEELTLLRLLKGQRCDGIAIFNLSLSDDTLLRAQELGRPVVVLGRPAPSSDLPAITIDNRAGSALAINHLTEHGHTQIAVVTGPRDNFDSCERLAGAQQALAAAGVPLPAERVWSGAFTEESGRAAMMRHLDSGQPLPEAIFACNDAMALGVRDALQARGERVPDDVALVGFDDIESVRHVGLTTVHVPMRQLGRRAGQVLIQRILRQEGPAASPVPVSLVVRGSCGCQLQRISNQGAG